MIRSFFYSLYLRAVRAVLPNLDAILDEAHTVLVKFDKHVQRLDSRVEARIALAQTLAEKNLAEQREADRAASIRDRIAEVLGV